MADFYFLFVYKETKKDNVYRALEMAAIQAEVKRLREMGFTVSVREVSTREDILNAIYDNEAIAIIRRIYAVTNFHYIVNILYSNIRSVRSKIAHLKALPDCMSKFSCNLLIFTTK